MDDVVENCDVCKALGQAPHVPIAGTSTVSMFNEKVQADLPFLGVPRICFPKTRFPLFNPRILRKFGAFSVEDGWAHSALSCASRWMREVNGRMRFGRICVQSVELSYNSEELALIFGNWNVVTGLRAEFIIVLLKMIG